MKYTFKNTVSWTFEEKDINLKTGQKIGKQEKLKTGKYRKTGF